MGKYAINVDKDAPRIIAINKDKWNKMWKSKLLSSGIAKVAIFDERIYSTFVASNGTQSISHISKLIKDKSKSEDEIVDELIKIGFTEDEAYAIAYKDPGFNEIIESKNPFFINLL